MDPNSMGNEDIHRHRADRALRGTIGLKALLSDVAKRRVKKRWRGPWFTKGLTLNQRSCLRTHCRTLGPALHARCPYCRRWD